MLAGARSGMLLFGITPPRRSVTPSRAKEIAEVALGRLADLDLDGLILYDIDDESDRNPGERPFPYLPTLDPADFHAEHLGAWDRPVIIYCCVGKYAEDELYHASEKGFCERLGMPYGFHVESVSIRKAEIEAAIRLAGELGALLRPARVEDGQVIRR